ncbi:uncharacterized protein LOC126907809 [Daktulosphaira vitifoliae]|uniref:uncharacterized protein LOC126907809 n=1 Tax=Daktulosphaira vitifoliae TaxID=58002 RepID=UPI0021A9E6A4|nr:uncharacterized protein LOC126907809 [Daktulosphaira vitifoliae]
MMKNKKLVDYFCKESNMMNNILIYDIHKKNFLRKLTYEILDSFIEQIDIRFNDFSYLEFVELTNENLYKHYSKTFPEVKLSQLLNQYPSYFDEHRLRNELQVVYSDTEKRISSRKMLDYFFKNDLHEIYSQYTKLCQLILSLPITRAPSNQSLTTLKRVKSFLRNTMENERLSLLSSIAIEKQLLGSMVRDPMFVEDVINEYAEEEDLGFALIYKDI